LTAEEQRFLDELEVLCAGAEAASQYLYAYLAIALRARDRQRVRRHVRENSTFWVTVQSALQTSCLIALGRVFDQNSQHNLDRLTGLATRGRLSIFTHGALRERKRRGGPEPKWLAQYIADADVPSADDFREMRRRVRDLRKVYEARYRELRDSFAHVGTTEQSAIAQLYGRAKIRELQRLVVRLLALHDALWGLFWDGRRPVVRQLRFSARPVPGLDAWAPVTTARPHERIVLQAERVLAQASRGSEGRNRPRK
jgi:hypothetical protein